MLLCAGGELWGQPLKGKQDRWINKVVSELKMRSCKGQVAAANLSLLEEWMVLKLLTFWRRRRATSLGQRNGCEKSGRKEIPSEKSTKWVGSEPGSLRQMALLVTTAATENPGDNRGSWQVFKDCYQLLSTNHIFSSADKTRLCSRTSLLSLHHWTAKMIFRYL